MTRWLNGCRGKRLAIRRISTKILDSDIILAQTRKDGSIINHILTSQAITTDTPPTNINKSELPCTVRGKFWVPESDIDSQYDILITHHCGTSGHRGIDSTLSAISETYVWAHMKKDCKQFVERSIHCLIGKAHSRISRPLSLTLHRTYPNEVIHFDYL